LKEVDANGVKDFNEVKEGERWAERTAKNPVKSKN
jgi:hypothetical protein